jgi:hypothetical protein
VTNRRTSLYSLRVATTVPGHVLADLVVALRTAAEKQPTDQHIATESGHAYASIGFRAKDDAEALAVVDAIAHRYPGRTTLMTGHGVHRREVSW